MLVGPDEFVGRLESLGFTNLKDGEYYGLSMALGSVDVSLYELTNAYRSLASGGKWSKLKLRPEEKTARHRQVMDRDVAYIISDILSDRTARGLTFGYETTLATRFWSAVKTGTSKDMRDNWCIGFSDRYTVGVWVGNASGEAMHSVSGVSGAAPVWQALVRHLHGGRPSLRPAVPAGIVSARVAFDAQREPQRDEGFIAGTAQPLQRATAAVAADGKAPGAGISSPRDGSVFALDPDIPPSAQRITFEGERGAWVLDGQRLGSGTRWAWAPWPGSHRLVLLGRDGQPIQSLRFAVRGAGVKTARR